jgi:hypothetical protein
VQDSPDATDDVDSVPPVGHEFKYKCLARLIGFRRELEIESPRIGLDLDPLHKATSDQNASVRAASIHRGGRNLHEDSVKRMQEPSPGILPKHQTNPP